MKKLIAPYSVEGIENCTIDEAIAYLSTKQLLGFDTETRQVVSAKASGPGLHQVIMAQIGDQERQYIFDVRTHLGDLAPL